MITSCSSLSEIQNFKSKSDLQVYTLGQFKVTRQAEEISPKAWGRDKAIQLFQYLLANSNAKHIHKEKIIDRLWEDQDMDDGNRDFKIALHGINKALEPERKSRSEPTYLMRQGISYSLNQNRIWIDSVALQHTISLAHNESDPDRRIELFYYANSIYQGIFLPNRIYEDWSSMYRENLQVLFLNATIDLAEISVRHDATETIRLTQQALEIDPSWEDAYALAIKAYISKGNRPMAIKTYKKCKDVLWKEFELEPLPETSKLITDIS